MKKASIVLALLLLVSLALGSIGCGGDDEGSSTEVVKIGAVLPLSGYLGTVGTETKKGLEFVVDEVNDAGGIKALGGATLELTVVDDKGDATITASEVERLITEEGVAAVVIGSDEVSQAQAAPLADQLKVPVIATGSYDSAVTAKGYDYFWAGNSSSSYPGMGEAFVRFLTRLKDDWGKDPKTVGLLTYQAADMLKNKSDILLPAFTAKGLSLVFDETHTFGVSSWDSYALKLKQANPDVFLAFTDPYSQTDLLKALDRLNYVPEYGLWLNLNWQSHIDMIGEDVAGRTLKAGGQFTTCSMVYTSGFQNTIDFKDKYEAVNGAGSYGLAIVGGQAGYLVLRAISDAKSGEPEKINDALSTVNLKEDDADLIMANFAPGLRFNDRHEPVDQGYFIAQWQADECHVVAPERFDTSTAQFK